ncbi:helix-turn-helix domain-containing protein [Streptomyces sp. NPDC048507]|uniref:helix-turn-helix domain-containing protein n=1 Tax=Streptomyces sp. NPDC048507 TaxID=3365560 RepID=UPI003719FFDD
MSLDWERLAEAIREARRSRGWTQADLAEVSGVGFSTVQRLEAGKPYRRRPPALDRVERALGWAAGSVDAVLEGGGPLNADEAAAAVIARAAGSERLPAYVAHELAAGEVVDTDVIELPDRPGVKVVVVVTRDADETGDTMAEDIRAWTRMKRQLRGISGE